MKPVIWIGITSSLLFLWTGLGNAEPNYEKLADAIRIAEGNPNYGVLTKYKTTTPRQACINTCRNQWKRHATHACGKDYLTCLRDRYCPIGAANDPTGLNKNWLPNVRKLYGKI